MAESITGRVLEYQAARSGLDRVIAAISEMVYRYPAGRFGFSEEDGAEFLINFYPRIRRLVERYRPSGATFEDYLRTTMRWQLRSFAAARTSERVVIAAATDRLTAAEIAGHDVAAEDPPTNDPARQVRRATPSSGPRYPRKRPANRPSALGLEPNGPKRARLTPGEAQRLICLALKSRDAFDEQGLERLSRMTGCELGWLEARYHELRVLNEALRAKRERIRERRDQAWFRMRCVETRLREASAAERERLQAERERWHLRYERSCARLERVQNAPTHAQIAAVLGIAKGTVDSGIYTIRQELRDPLFRERLASLSERA